MRRAAPPLIGIICCVRTEGDHILHSVSEKYITAAVDAAGGLPVLLPALGGRVFPAAVFWQSGQTKVAGWHLKPSAIALFQSEYQLPIIDPTAAAYLSAFGEHLFPVLLVLGLANLSLCGFAFRRDDRRQTTENRG